MKTSAEGRIESVNVGTPREIVRYGRPTTTAIWKEPVVVAAGDGFASAAAPAHPVTIGLIAHLNHADRKLAQLLLDAAFAKLDPAAWDELLAMIRIPA